MAQLPVRLNTQGMTFPLLSRQSGMTVVNGQGDLTYVPGVNSDGDTPEQRGIPDIMFCENVMPSTYGWQSVGYRFRVEASTSGAGTDVVYQNFMVFGGKLVSGEIVPSNIVGRVVSQRETATTAALYIFDSFAAKQWVKIAALPEFDYKKYVSYAMINGLTYICIPGHGVYAMDVELKEAQQVTLAGLTQSAFNGVFTTNGYMLAWTETRVVWSSVVDPLDFVPSETTGAGGGGVQEAKGRIVFCVGIPNGFLVFTDTNCVAAIYTANDLFPFEFRELSGVGGLDTPKLLSNNTIAGNHYLWGSKGLQRVGMNGGKTTLANIADFVRGKEFESYNYSTNTIVKSPLTDSMGVRVECVADRYIVVSYNQDGGIKYTHALVVDALQNRMGKLRIDHVKCIDYQHISYGKIEELDSRIAFMKPDGSIYMLETAYNLWDSSEYNSVLMLGKIQYTRERYTELQELRVESQFEASAPVVSTHITYDGKTLEPAVSGFPDPANTGRLNKRYYFSTVGLNHTLVFKDKFDLTSILAILTVHGIT